MAAESGRDVCGNVSVALLITLILLNVVKVVPAHDDGAVHLCALHLSAENTATNRNIANEGALLVNVVTLNSLLGGLEAKTNRLVPPVATLAGNLGGLLGDLLVAAGNEKNREMGEISSCGGN